MTLHSSASGQSALVRLGLLWVAIVGSMFLATAIGGPTGEIFPHLMLHAIFILIIFPLWIWLALRWREASAWRTMRVFAWIVIAFTAAAAVGQTGESVVVIGHGGLTAPVSVMIDPAHRAWARQGCSECTSRPGPCSSRARSAGFACCAPVIAEAGPRCCQPSSTWPNSGCLERSSVGTSLGWRP